MTALIHDKKDDILMHRWRYPSLSIHGQSPAYTSPCSVDVLCSFILILIFIIQIIVLCHSCRSLAVKENWGWCAVKLLCIHTENYFYYFLLMYRNRGSFQWIWIQNSHSKEGDWKVLSTTRPWSATRGNQAIGHPTSTAKV